MFAVYHFSAFLCVCAIMFVPSGNQITNWWSCLESMYLLIRLSDLNERILCYSKSIFSVKKSHSVSIHFTKKELQKEKIVASISGCKRLYNHHTWGNNNNNSSKMSCMSIYSESTGSYTQNSVILISEVINIVILFVLSVSPVPDTLFLLIEAHPFK